MGKTRDKLMIFCKLELIAMALIGYVHGLFGID